MNPHGSRPILVLVGPTGVGKSDVALHAAMRLSGEIVSADSRLLYRLMDIGTAKPDAAMRQAVPHHLVDVADPDRQYTSKDYEREARKVVGDILGRGHLPVVVGGTGLYVRALLEGIFDGPAADRALRENLRETARLKGKEFLWKKLAEVDPDKARSIAPQNLSRVIRALEVFDLTGRPMTVLEKGTAPMGVASVKIGLMRDRKDLYRLIEQRVDRMIESGLVDEVKRLVAVGYAGSPVVRNSLGYREVLRHLEGSLSLEDAIDLIKKNTRHFAKRQITWFAKDKGIIWLDVTGRSDCLALASEVCEVYERAK